MTALNQVFTGAPSWAWVALAALIALGASQLRVRRVARLRLLIGPLAMGIYSCVSLTMAFGEPLLVDIAWLLAATVTAVTLARRPPPAGTRFDRGADVFVVPGSVVPLLAMLGIFTLRFAMGAAAAVATHSLQAPLGTLAVGAVAGALSGLLLGRSMRTLRLAAA